MRLQHIKVLDFGCIESADVEFGPGLNILHGPNDWGKTTLASAIRAVLLLLPNSSAAVDFRPWHRDKDPEVSLTFEHGGRIWRVEKTWSASTRRRAALYVSDDGETFRLDEEARGVDGKLRDLLGWGVAGPGGRGGTRGLPRSFLASVLLGEQAQPYGVFDLSLADDTDDSAKTRLRAALEAMAVDPLYERVVQESQAKVSEAFTDKGDRSRRRESPFRRVADDVARRREDAESWEKRYSESDAVEQRLADVDAERERLMSERIEALERRTRMQRDLDRIALLERTTERWSTLKARMDELDEIREAIATLDRELREDVARRSALEAEARREEASLQDRVARLAEAQARVGALKEGGHATEQLERRNLEHRRLECQASCRDVELRVDQFQAALEASAAVEASIQDEAARVGHLERVRGQVQEIDDAIARAVAGRRDAEACLVWARYHQAQQAVLEVEEAIAALAARRAERSVCRQAVDDARAAWTSLGLPSRDELAVLRRVASELELARAGLGGGLGLKIAIQKAILGSSLTVDGVSHAIDRVDGLEAHRELELVLPGVLTLEVRAGDRTARETWERATQAYAQAVEPVLARTGSSSVEALESASRAAETRLERLERAQAEADVRYEHAEARVSAMESLDDRRARAAEQRALLGDDATRLAELAPSQSDSAWASDVRRHAEAEHDARTRRDGMQGALLRIQVEAAAAQAETLRATAALRERLERLGLKDVAALPSLLEQARAELRTAQEAIVDVDRDLTALEARHAAVEAEAEAECTAASREVADGRQRFEAAQRSVAELDDRIAKGRGALGVRRTRLAQIDTMALAEAFARVNDELERCERPEHAVDASGLAALDESLARLETRLDAVNAEFRRHQGALAQIGGDVVRDRARAAREGLERALREEAEVELDYEAWKLLLTTLREAENDEGRHVGRVLARDIGQRLGELAKGRYGTLSLGPELQTLGLDTRDGLKPVSAFSEGLKEQLATLLRISVAEHLQGTLLLDDHLAQTDLERVAWFRELLQRRGEVTQILLLTCRPQEYLGAVHTTAEDPPVVDVTPSLRSIDLRRRIVRAGGG